MDLDGDWRWNGCWLVGGEARRGDAAEPKMRCFEECAVALPVEGTGLIPSTVGSTEHCEENGVVRLGGEAEGKLLGATEKGGGGNSHCWVSAVSRQWQWK